MTMAGPNGNGSNGHSNGHAPDEWEDDYEDLARALEEPSPELPKGYGDDERVRWYADCKLRTILTRPRRHELTTPGNQRVILTTEDLLSASRFTAVFVDEVGSFPDLPAKGANTFLREMVQHWLRVRETVEVDEEAGQFGLLTGEIRRSLLASSESDDPKHLTLGAVVVLEDGDRIFAPRPIMVRVRAGGLVQFRAGEFYAALRELGCFQRSSTFYRGVRVRAWTAPAALWLPAPDAAGDAPVAVH